ncbi:MAG TPA: LytTR family DNA-binding domain-containing protein [Cyclobacteriaceae bacterium]|nr:LytTR family DNA-binding domain-containing protein [Cyclobacteriaceae bacterium]
MSISCVIVDDEPLARSLLKDYVSKIPSLKLVDVCPSPLTAMEVLKTNAVDLLFLDIQMPEITGISLLKILKKKPLVVLTTAYSEYALESYELDVVDYLLKPITFQRFLQAVDKVSSRLQQPPALVERAAPSASQPFIFVKDGTKLVKVKWEDILYIEGLKDYVTIHTRQQKIVSLQRLKSLEEQLPAEQFIRIHNSFIVALSAIDSVQKNEVHIGQAVLPISDSYKKSFRDLIEKNHLQ